MKCNSCSIEMTDGEVSIQTSMLRFLSAGISANFLEFRNEDGSEKVQVLDSKPLLSKNRKYFKKANYCKKCGGIFITGK